MNRSAIMIASNDLPHLSDLSDSTYSIKRRSSNYAMTATAIIHEASAQAAPPPHRQNKHSL
ncbi:hypothetical protein [Streptosporangium sp. LJ11]|uniref:hypothetical protein n=1 Tax=Streptosporangium sp. LJ11 TaxID=3436927 RepID=UPI003F7B1588